MLSTPLKEGINVCKTNKNAKKYCGKINVPFLSSSKSEKMSFVNSKKGKKN
jgi:hypothetical protein